MISQKRIQKVLVQLIALSILWIATPLFFEAQANGEGDATDVAQAVTVATETTLSTFPLQQDVFPGGTVQVNVMIEQATDLYGLQVSCQVDPTILAWKTAEFAGFFTDTIVGANNFDATTGTWMAAISQKNPAPALSGDGIFATLTFQAIAPGTTTVVCEPLAAGQDGFEVPMSVSNTPLNVKDVPVDNFGLLVGQILYQGRTDHSGMHVALTGISPKETASQTAGQFEVTELESGEYNLTVDADLYLPSCTTLMVNPSEVTTLDTTQLYGGDTDNDDEIRINDATLIGSNFGLTPSSTPPMNPRADINADGQVNVQDLSILGGNFGKTGCQPWIPEAQFTDTTSTVTSS